MLEIIEGQYKTIIRPILGLRRKGDTRKLPRFAREVEALHRLGVEGQPQECFPRFYPERPGLYYACVPGSPCGVHDDGAAWGREAAQQVFHEGAKEDGLGME